MNSVNKNSKIQRNKTKGKKIKQTDKLCFYVKIEEYRKSIRKTTILLEDKGGSSRPLADGLALKARTHLVKLVTVFTKFLSDGSSFYQDLMLQVRERVREREKDILIFCFL